MTSSQQPERPSGGSEAASLPLVTDIQRATHVLGLYLEAQLADLHLTQAEIHVLSLLARPGRLSVTELQRGVRHRPSTLTGILDRLTAKKMVRRQINEADRRSYLIELTPAGQAAADRVVEAMAAIERELFADRSPQDLAFFRGVLRRIATELSVP
jgi:DNA-binding MarR family transcriptional regulator